jgi:N-acetylneuraminate synthase
LILLHCVSLYPPPDAEVRLRNIPMLRDAFEIPVGYSDHTLGAAVSLAAVALGACLVEKHFTLDRSMQGWDHWMSADPPELALLCQGARQIHASMGSTRRVVGQAELQKRNQFRRSVVARRDMPAGHVVQLDDLDFKRPGTGISPTEYRFIVGRTLRTPAARDQALAWSDFE